MERGDNQCPPSIHGRKAVAPLRRFGLFGHHFVEVPIHGRKAVAPLRRLTDRSGHRFQPPIHGRKAVAPLRRTDRRQGHRTRSTLSTAERPWLHCGTSSRNRSTLCAARLSTAERPWLHCGFRVGLEVRPAGSLSTAERPWLHCGTEIDSHLDAAVVGLSTAERPWLHCRRGLRLHLRPGPRRLRYPRPKGRGSIAAPCSSDRCSRRPPIHGRKAVAPLRRDGRDVHVRRDRPSYPRPKGRGSIAAPSWVSLPPPAWQPLSTAERPWLHCGLHEDDKGFLYLVRLSTAERPWLHCGRSGDGPDAPPWRYPRPKGRGSIAAAGAPWHRRCLPCAIHGRKAVAPLRQVGLAQPLRELLAAIHGRKAVAPLRREAVTARRDELRPDYPRPKGRGSIAAPASSVAAASRMPSLSTAERPWLHCGACQALAQGGTWRLSTAERPWLIAAERHRCHRSHRVADYPRPKGRGSIAARRRPPAPAPSADRTSIHGRKAVAPLRLRRAGMIRRYQLAYPRPKGRGSIAAHRSRTSWCG